MDAVRVARGVTGRHRIVKVEGGYHGHSDSLLVSTKPPADAAGPAAAPRPVAATHGLPPAVLDDIVVVPYNDVDALAAALAPRDIACFVVEPVMENIGICLPVPGYLEAVRELTREFGTLLLFDEVKTGITAAWHGAGRSYGVLPDLIAVGKSIGGGVPLGAFGGTEECMDAIATGTVLHVGTFNGNPLCMAAARAVLQDVHARRNRARHRRQHLVRLANCRAFSPPASCPRTSCDAGRRAASRGQSNRCGTTATTWPPTWTSRSRSGSGASTAACCCRRVSASNGCSRSRTPAPISSAPSTCFARSPTQWCRASGVSCRW